MQINYWYIGLRGVVDEVADRLHSQLPSSVVRVVLEGDEREIPLRIPVVVYVNLV